jgi:hypothetical protein
MQQAFLKKKQLLKLFPPKLIFMCFFHFVLLFFLLMGCCGFTAPQPLPEPYNLSFSVALDPSVNVYAVDKRGNVISSIEHNEYFFPVQSGLPLGTVYTFRLLRQTGEIVVPANEKFTVTAESGRLKFEPGLQQYHNFPAGKYVIELVKLEGSHGTIVARANITITSPFEAAPESMSIIEQNCSQFLPAKNSTYPSMDFPGAASLYSCIGRIASATGDPEICKGIISYFKDGIILADWCIGDFAINKSDLSLCSKRGRAVDRASCRSEILNDWHECLGFECDIGWSCEEQKEICLQGFALSHKDAALCNMLKNDDYRNRCLGLVLLDKSYCNLISDSQSRSSCIRYIDDAPTGGNRS